MRERRQRVALCSPAGWQEEEERKGVAANSIISCCSVKPFVYSPLTPWLLYLRNTIKDCEGVARTVELFDTLSLFNWNKSGLNSSLSVVIQHGHEKRSRHPEAV